MEDARPGRSTCFSCHKDFVEKAVSYRPRNSRDFKPAETSLIEDARKILTDSALTRKGLAEIEQMVLDAYEALSHLEKNEKKPEEPNGLYGKYRVFKHPSGEAVNDCFVLRPVKDKAARKALGTYAVSGVAPELCKDLVAWIEKLEKESPL